jgi:23S rRNA pseudouridine2605 synthase
MSAPPSSPPETAATAGERIAKRLARAGLCSRREAERWIAARRVAVDGRVIDTAATLVGPHSAITVDGKLVGEAQPARLWRYHKPRGLVCTHRDPQNRATVFDNLPPGLPRVVSVGRLDLNSEGLLLLTNDGTLARRLERSDWVRRYRVRVFGRIDAARLAALARGVTLDGVRYEPIEAALDSATGSNSWLTMSLREGRNREIRLVLADLGLTVNRLIRLSFGPFQLGALKRGAVEAIPARVLADQLGEAPPKRPRHAHPRR